MALVAPRALGVGERSTGVALEHGEPEAKCRPSDRVPAADAHPPREGVQPLNILFGKPDRNLSAKGPAGFHCIVLYPKESLCKPHAASSKGYWATDRPAALLEPVRSR